MCMNPMSEGQGVCMFECDLPVSASVCVCVPRDCEPLRAGTGLCFSHYYT